MREIVFGINLFDIILISRFYYLNAYFKSGGHATSPSRSSDL